MLLRALVACAGVTLRAVATNRSVELGGTVRAERDLDFRGTLGIDASAPVGFQSIRLIFDLDSSADAATIEDLLATTERACVVLQTLTNGVDVSVERH